MPLNQADTPSSVFMVVVTDRGKGEEMADMMADKGVTFNMLTLGRGTADKKILSYLGIGESEKDVLCCCMKQKTAQHIMETFKKNSSLDKPGKGIAFCIPIGSIPECMKYLNPPLSEQNHGGLNMDLNEQYGLIVAVTNQGYADDVMVTAKEAGATGGTIIHARGVGLKEAEKFFGVTIQAEKEMIFILTEEKNRQNIMSNISEKNGIKTDAKTMIFSLPVNGVAGTSSNYKTD